MEKKKGKVMEKVAQRGVKGDKQISITIFGGGMVKKSLLLPFDFPH